ncbi:MAG: dihydrodipicolinate reductase [Promethearchaeota archaeon]
MSKPFTIIQVGLGPMGRLIANLLLKRKNIDVKGVIDIDPQLVGKKLSEFLDVENNQDFIIESSLGALLAKEKVDVVIIATSSSLEKVAPLIKQAVNSGSNVISICEELSYPFKLYPKLTEDLNSLAKSNNVTVVGTGINPGYLMDLLPIVITAPCQFVKSIEITRMMNSAKRREPFQRKIGTGLTSKEFHQKISEKEITGHVGLTQSIQMIIAALGFQYDEITEFPPKEIIAEEEFTTSYGEKVPKGYVCGLKSKAIAKKGEEEILILDFVAYTGDHDEYDSIKINGNPPIQQKIIGGVHGDIGTAAMVANLIPIAIKAKTGLLTMKDLPVPCYTENIWKNSI